MDFHKVEFLDARVLLCIGFNVYLSNEKILENGDAKQPQSRIPRKNHGAFEVL